MSVQLRHQDTLAGIEPEMLHGFFSGWKHPHAPETHLHILKESDHVVVAIDEEKGAVVGFVTALSDHVQAAFIPLLEVVPNYRGQGVGSELMRRMLTKLEGTPAIDLTCAPELQSFYRRFGMTPSTGMILRNH